MEIVLPRQGVLLLLCICGPIVMLQPSPSPRTGTTKKEIASGRGARVGESAARVGDEDP